MALTAPRFHTTWRRVLGCASPCPRCDISGRPCLRVRRQPARSRTVPPWPRIAPPSMCHLGQDCDATLTAPTTGKTRSTAMVAPFAHHKARQLYRNLPGEDFVLQSTLLVDPVSQLFTGIRTVLTASGTVSLPRALWLSSLASSHFCVVVPACANVVTPRA